MDFGSLGPIMCLGLAAAGSAIGCGVAGMTSHGVMSKVDEGHAKFVALSAMPASQSIYGFALMIILNGKLQELISAGKDTFSVFAIGLATGLAFMLSAIYQGKACSSAILAVAKKPEVFGMSFAAPGIVESFALFALVGGIMMAA
ncbi:MAG TPA: ATP synthase subunit C [bacterium]|jgi:V/A-type H+-transporting ATPase subunit K|nr:ATP synthase subunit C [bacterium]MDX9805761.1 ATP synthase subunit C [bacterium]HPM47396.1 ATP synthase subunit C [bacterium]HPV22507.1 ATP synthase subunit C [bacterium]HQM85135.1 ATP synthase subunit C [bacterium]